MPAAPLNAAAAAVAACAQHVDKEELARRLDQLDMEQLDMLAAAVRDATFRRRAGAARAPAPSPAQSRAAKKAPKGRSSDRDANRAEDDEFDGGISGRWHGVPAGGTLPGLEQSSRAATPPSAPKTASRKTAIGGDLD